MNKSSNNLTMSGYRPNNQAFISWPQYQDLGQSFFYDN